MKIIHDLFKEEKDIVIVSDSLKDKVNFQQNNNNTIIELDIDNLKLKGDLIVFSNDINYTNDVVRRDTLKILLLGMVFFVGQLIKVLVYFNLLKT